MLDDFKKEKYCQERASGKSQRQAYLEAYPNSRKWKPKTVDERACKLEKESKVLTRLRELQAAAEQQAELSRQNLLDKLQSIIDISQVRFKGSDIIKAIQLYAEMCGYNREQTQINNGILEKLTEYMKDEKNKQNVE